MSVPAATTLALWGAAHAGGVSPDATLTALAGTGITAGVRRAGEVDGSSPVAGLSGPGDLPVGTAALLPLLRSGPPILVLPVAGDVRGLPPEAGSTGLRETALAAGAAVGYPDAGVTVVPADGIWRVFPAVGRVPQHDRATATKNFDDAVHRATEMFLAGELGVDAAQARALVADQVDRRTVALPAGTPARAASLIDRCVRLEAIVAVAAGHRTAAVNLFEIGVISDALAPLAAAARQARMAAVADGVRALVPARHGEQVHLRATDPR